MGQSFRPRCVGEKQSTVCFVYIVASLSTSTPVQEDPLSFTVTARTNIIQRELAVAGRLAGERGEQLAEQGPLHGEAAEPAG